MRLWSVAVLVCLAGACRENDRISPGFVEESRRAQQATVPDGSRVQVSAAEIGELSVSQTWTVTGIRDWAKYLEDAARELQPDYECSSTGARTITCTRQLPADALRLSLAPAPDGAGASALVRLEASPD